MKQQQQKQRQPATQLSTQAVTGSTLNTQTQAQMIIQAQASLASQQASAPKKSSCLEEIERLKQNREERRKKMDDLRKLKVEREQLNEAQGIKVDVDFQAMVENHMRNVSAMRPHIPADELKICVCVKKRPVFMNELANGEIDCVSVSNPVITVHECKFKVDGITKFVDNSEFIFDNSFSHLESNEELYNYSIQPIIDLVFNQGIVTVFAYGQTGSGKTYTMQGLQELAIHDLFERGITYFQDHKRNFTVTISMYEIYGGKVYDLLNNHEQLKILEDKSQKIQIQGLKEQFVQSEEEILNLISFGNSVRTTHATKANDTSSRSHAICQIKVHEEGAKAAGKLLLVDLAGSERAYDCQQNNKDRQQEGAEINKSLLALKECVRALDAQKGQASQGQHVPFRACKLTMVLRDSFMQGEKTKIVMLACICPGSSSADHTLNTLRYAERLKEKPAYSPAIQINQQQQVQQQIQGQQQQSQQSQQQILQALPSQNSVDDQIKMFKQKSNNPKNEDHHKKPHPLVVSGTQNTNSHHPQSHLQKPGTAQPVKSAQNTVNKDLFYHQNTLQTQSVQPSQLNDFDQDDVLQMENDDEAMAMIDEPKHSHQINHMISAQQQQQPNPAESPLNKLFTKVAAAQQVVSSQQQQKHNFQQQQQNQTAAKIKDAATSQLSNLIKNKQQQPQVQQQQQQQQKGQTSQQYQHRFNQQKKTPTTQVQSTQQSSKMFQSQLHQVEAQANHHHDENNSQAQDLYANISPRQKKPTPYQFSQTMTKQSPPPAIQQTPTTISSVHPTHQQALPSGKSSTSPVPAVKLNYGANGYQNNQQHVHPMAKNQAYVDMDEEDQFMQPNGGGLLEDEDEEKIAAEENLLNEHLACVKEEAQLITQEGELITKIERQMVHEAQYDMKGYLDMAEVIAKKKLEMYSKLLGDISEFRMRFDHH